MLFGVIIRGVNSWILCAYTGLMQGIHACTAAGVADLLAGTMAAVAVAPGEVASACTPEVRDLIDRVLQ